MVTQQKVRLSQFVREGGGAIAATRLLAEVIGQSTKDKSWAQPQKTKTMNVCAANQLDCSNRNNVASKLKNQRVFVCLQYITSLGASRETTGSQPLFIFSHRTCSSPRWHCENMWKLFFKHFFQTSKTDERSCSLTKCNSCYSSFPPPASWLFVRHQAPPGF